MRQSWTVNGSYANWKITVAIEPGEDRALIVPEGSPIRGVLELTGLGQILAVFDDRADAVAHVRAQSRSRIRAET